MKKITPCERCLDKFGVERPGQKYSGWETIMCSDCHDAAVKAWAERNRTGIDE